ncbi:MAG: hypothetical protein MUE65_02075, partial [Methanomassiliicoccales archaeon]|nr:hypothetical protein [Methanomassiliicoccales archaeon]
MAVAKAGTGGSVKAGRKENHVYVRSVSFRPRGRMDGKTLSMALSVSMAMGFEALLVDGVLEGRIQAQATTDDGRVRVTHSGPGPKVEAEDSLGGAMVREGK